jgi:hypothetical protein
MPFTRPGASRSARWAPYQLKSDRKHTVVTLESASGVLRGPRRARRRARAPAGQTARNSETQARGGLRATLVPLPTESLILAQDERWRRA